MNVCVCVCVLCVGALQAERAAREATAQREEVEKVIDAKNLDILVVTKQVRWIHTCWIHTCEQTLRSEHRGE